MGTPPYMAPEQINDEHAPIDRRTDVHALGVILFEVMTGRRPFEGPTAQSIYRAVLTRPPPDILEVNPALPKDLRVIVETALDKDPDRRYQTAQDLAEDLRRVRHFEPVQAKPITRWVRLRRWSQRNPAIAGSLLLAFVFMGAGLFASLWSMQEARSALGREQEALRQRTNALQVQATTLAEKKATVLELEELSKSQQETLRQLRSREEELLSVQEKLTSGEEGLERLVREREEFRISAAENEGRATESGRLLEAARVREGRLEVAASRLRGEIRKLEDRISQMQDQARKLTGQNAQDRTRLELQIAQTKHDMDELRKTLNRELEGVRRRLAAKVEPIELQLTTSSPEEIRITRIVTYKGGAAWQHVKEGLMQLRPGAPVTKIHLPIGSERVTVSAKRRDRRGDTWTKLNDVESTIDGKTVVSLKIQ